MRRTTTISEVREAVADARQAGDRVGLVPTMGALHEGHLSLVRHAAELADTVVVSIFVNPTQFGPGEDLEAYPRDLDGDEGQLAGLGDAAPDLVFAPAVEEVYPREPLTTVHVDHLTAVLCGASRPGHFDGVTTVVAKLLTIVGPDVAVFGRKDYQQLTVIRRMVADLDIPVEIAGAPTVREPDGVAMSSRNDYLDQDQRRTARVLSRALRQAVELARDARRRGDRPDASFLQQQVLGTLDAEPDVRVDYVDVLDAETLEQPDGPDTRGETPSGDRDGAATPDRRAPQRLLVAVAAHVGPARLIDNVVIGDRDDEDRLLAATG